jgi:gmma-aminobutyric acid receptor subunit gamma/cGMP-dependent protein kinase 2
MIITSTLPVTLDPLQFSYHPNRSTDDAIAITLHTALSHLDKRNTYVRMLGPGLGNNTSTSLFLKTGAPQGCVLSPIMYSPFTHDCVATHACNSIIKFADDTTVVGLITNNDETAYREEVRAL